MNNLKRNQWENVISKIEDELKLDSVSTRSELFELVVNSIHSLPHFQWTGIYWLDNSKSELNLEYYLGKPTDHTRIAIGKGVCGTAVAENRDIIIEDVRKISNYLACSLETRSEIVVLIKDSNDNILGQIDVDSDEISAFDELDSGYLSKIANKIGSFPLLTEI